MHLVFPVILWHCRPVRQLSLHHPQFIHSQVLQFQHLQDCCQLTGHHTQCTWAMYCRWTIAMPTATVLHRPVWLVVVSLSLYFVLCLIACLLLSVRSFLTSRFSLSYELVIRSTVASVSAVYVIFVSVT